ncbi:MAG TPA: molybdopterin-dependent oxidoreductase [Ktedonobacterales bacterium]
MLPTSRAAARAAIGPALLAGSLAVVAALALRYFFALPTPAELYADQATTRIPLPLFEAMLTTFGTAAKHLYLIGGLIGEAALTALGGVLYAVTRQLTLSRWARTRDMEPHTESQSESYALTYQDAPLIALTLLLLSGVVLAPLIGGGFFGAALVGGAPVAALSQITPDLVFAFAFVAQSRAVARARMSTEGAPEDFTRRAFLRQSALAVVTLGGGIALWQALTSGLGALVGAGPARATQPALSLSDVPERITPPPTPVYGAYTTVSGQSPEVTAATDFYYVSKNLAGDPTIDGASWKLAFTGMVDKPYTLTYGQLRALPQVTQYHTLECISNEVGGDLMSTGYFTGVRLADALNAAGIQRGATELIFKAADGYSDNLHLSQALDDRSLIVYLLNGQPLPQPHGFPARLLIPGLYGMKNGKWLTELSVASGPYDGYWEQRGWTHQALVKLTSRIDTPHDGDLLAARPVLIAGVAYSGDQGISRVDVSVDGGRTWAPATLKRPLGELSWTLWEYAWSPASGAHLVVVRAIDLAGRVQTPAEVSPLPDGSSGYHAITITVR